MSLQEALDFREIAGQFGPAGVTRILVLRALGLAMASLMALWLLSAQARVWAIVMILILILISIMGVMMIIMIIIMLFVLKIPVVALFDWRLCLRDSRLSLLLRPCNGRTPSRLGCRGIGAASALDAGGRVDGIAASVAIASLGHVGNDQFVVDACAKGAISRLSLFDPTLTGHDTGAGCALAARRW
jgi:hypothetical protein